MFSPSRPVQCHPTIALGVAMLVLGACFPDPKILDRNDTGSGSDTTNDGTDPTDALQCSSNNDCATLAGPCIDASCEQGRCITTVRDGLSCDDGDLCTTDDICNGNDCVGEAKACDVPGVCQGAGACDATTGACIYTTLGNGTPCNDGDRCTAGDSCLDGACVATRPPDDQFGDWVVTFSGSAGVKVGAMVRVGNEIGVAVEFMHDGTEAVPWVEASGSRSSSTPRITLADGELHGVAFFRISANGRDLSGGLVARSQGPIAILGLAAAADDTWFLSGTIAGAAVLGPVSNSNYEVTSGPDGTSWFGIRLGFGSQWSRPPWLIDRGLDTTKQAPIRFIAAGRDCVMVSNVSGGNVMKVRRDNVTVAEVEGPENNLQAVWIGWDQGCSGSLTAQRVIQTRIGGEVLFWDANGAPDGSVALSGVSQGQVVVKRPGGETNAVYDHDTQVAFSLVFGADKSVESAVTVIDSVMGMGPEYAYSQLPTGILLSDEKILVSFVSLGIAKLDVRRGSQPVETLFAPGNPPSNDDILPRAVLFELDRKRAGAERGSIITGGEFKGSSPFASLTLGMGAGDFVAVPNIDCCDVNLDYYNGFDIVRVYERGEPTWTGTFMQRRNSTGPSFTKPLLTETFPVGPSVVFAASIAGQAVQVGGTIVDPRSGTAAFVTRVNSDNEHACQSR